MCFSPNIKQATAPGAPAPPVAPPGNTPAAPVLNASAGTSPDGMTASSASRRGASSLKIDLNSAGQNGNGLSIPT